MLTPRTVVDARWLGYSGVGRFTELLLAGLSELAPPGAWAIWGRPDRRRELWSGASWVDAPHSPLAGLGQRGSRRMPRAHRYLFPHLVRPLLRRPAVVVAHDTIPVRFAEPVWQRPAQRLFYALSARTARAVVVYSDATRRRVVDDLRLPAERIRRVEMPVDPTLALRARAARARSVAATGSPFVLYVGLDRPQKNLRRALEGFARSAFAAEGGRFVLLGIQRERIAELEAFCRSRAISGVTVSGRCSDDDLVDHLARARALVQPSLEEGLGLPVLEARVAGLPVACSRVDALEEAAAGNAELFDPRSPAAIAEAIDRAVAGAATGEPPSFPTPIQLARQVVAVLDELG